MTGPSDSGSGAVVAGRAGANAPATTAATTLVEVAPGTAVVFGDIPHGLELIDFGLIPPEDRAKLSNVLTAIGSGAAAVGGVANAAAGAQGLYRITDATRSLLEAGGQLAVKDGANLGAIFQNGRIVGQARFVPVGAAATGVGAVVALAPAIAMIAMQMQLNEISGLVRTNIALTTQTLKAIRHEQWSEVTGLVDTIGRAVQDATEIQAVTESLWEHVAGNGAPLRKQLDLYRRNVDDHVRQLGKARGRARREYLETNAEAILFDANALLMSLKAHTGYQLLRAVRARTNGAGDEREAQLVEVISRDTRAEFDAAYREAGDLIVALTRELSLIAQLPDRPTIPLPRKRRDAKVIRLTSTQILEALEPLAAALRSTVEQPELPEVVCAPDGLDLTRFLRVLQWSLEPGETLRAVAFPHQSGTRDVVGTVPAVLGKQVDASWAGLVPGRWSGVLDKAASSTFVAVTDRRIMTAPARGFLQTGDVETSFALDDVRYLRAAATSETNVRTSIDIVTRDKDFRWTFPAAAHDREIGEFAAVLAEKVGVPEDERAAIESLRVSAVTLALPPDRSR
ncbi:hypothetical protein [Millisia brevis]|uniref:hypothetical protein n=1 Tax=Millisia brevis TaxID=264148 RepID=UPI0008361C15|nr:hypothetical protein [Millisia brevis]